MHSMSSTNTSFVPPSVATPAPPLRLLVIEDNPIYSTWLAAHLHRASSTPQQTLVIELASTLAQASERLLRERFDAILLDLNLPDSKGLDTVTAITALARDIAIIVVSATSDESLALQALAQGAQDYIFKGQESEGGILRTVNRSLERKGVERALGEANERAVRNERMASIGLLASGVAHEYNNLGTVILGNTELILKTPDLPPQVRIRAERIRESASRAATVTSSLLAYVRGFKDGERRLVVDEVLESTLVMIEPLFKQHGIAVALEQAATPLAVQGNASILGQVLLNLLQNACHALADRPLRRITVTTRAEAEGTRVRIDVADTGCGMSPENLAQIFTPLFTTKAANDRGDQVAGTGIGLAVCQSFIQQLGGTITVASRLGEGSQFSIHLPLARGPEPLAAAPEAAPDLSGRRILVVEDDPEIQGLYATTLEELGAQTERASSVPEALARIDPFRPDLVLLDWHLAGRTGADVVHRLQLIPLAHRPAILVSSGNLAPAEHTWLLGLKHVAVLNKPVWLADLQRKVASMLIRRPAIPQAD